MSNTNDQGPQNLAQAEAEALKALEAGAWRVWQAGSGPLPAAYARWCAAEIELATAALRARAEKAEARAQKAEAERDRYKRDVSEYEEREAACCPEDVGFEEVIASLRKRAEAAEAEVARLRGMMDRAVPYITQTGLGAAIYEAVKREARATPAERAAAGLEPVDAGLVGQHGELLKAAVAKEAPAQPQVIPGSLRGFPWDADWDKVIDGDAVIYGGRKITFRVEPFRADPHPAPAPADGSAAKFDEAIAAFDRARAEWREAIKQPQVLPEHLAYIEYLASNSCSTEARALRAAVARRDGGAK